METFARIIDTPSTQVLCYTEYDPVEEAYVLHQICIVEHVQGDMKIIFDGPGAARDVEAALGNLTEQDAHAVVNAIRENLRLHLRIRQAPR
jgi:hypothetical protein